MGIKFGTMARGFGQAISGAQQAKAKQKQAEKDRMNKLQDQLVLSVMKGKIDEKFGKWVPKTMEEAVQFEKAKASMDPFKMYMLEQMKQSGLLPAEEGGTPTKEPVPVRTGAPGAPLARSPQGRQPSTPIGGIPQGKFFREITPTGIKRVQTPQSKAEQEVAKQTVGQEAKQGAKLQRELKTSHTKMNTMFGAWLDTVNRTMELTKIKPGPGQAPFTAILGATKTNQFQEAFKGAEPEYAAAIGRMAVPGARSVRLIDLFKKGAPSAWSTIPSGINNSAKSARMALAGYLGTTEGSEALGIPYDPLNPNKWNTSANRALDRFENLYKEGLYEMVYLKNPNLLDGDTRARMDSEFNKMIKKRGY